MTDTLVATCTGVTGITGIELREAYNQAVVNIEITATAHSLSIGDSVNVVLGTGALNATVMSGGIVRKVLTRVPDYNYVITIQDVLCRAVDFFIASDDPNNPYKATNIKAEDLVVYLLGLAGLTSVVTDSTIFTYGSVTPTPINLLSVWDMVNTISQITMFNTYCDSAGTIHFVDRKPYVTASDTSSSHSYTTGDSGDILSIEYDRNVESLRNKVVVYGGVGNSVVATASAVSPYLPAGFYKSTVIAHPLIDTLAAAQDTADINLAAFNRLTETVSLTVKGNVGIRCRSIVDITESFTGLTASTRWLVYGNTMTLSNRGFEQALTLVK